MPRLGGDPTPKGKAPRSGRALTPAGFAALDAIVRGRSRPRAPAASASKAAQRHNQSLGKRGVAVAGGNPRTEVHAERQSTDAEYRRQHQGDGGLARSAAMAEAASERTVDGRGSGQFGDNLMHAGSSTRAMCYARTKHLFCGAGGRFPRRARRGPRQRQNFLRRLTGSVPIARLCKPSPARPAAVHGKERVLKGKGHCAVPTTARGFVATTAVGATDFRPKRASSLHSGAPTRVAANAVWAGLPSQGCGIPRASRPRAVARSPSCAMQIRRYADRGVTR